MPSSSAAVPSDTEALPATEREGRSRPHRVSRALLAANVAAVVVPPLGFIAAAYLLWGWGFSWTQLAIFAVMYVGTGLGVTVGYHRLFTHKSFATVKPVSVALGILGSMAVEGPLFMWAATHRCHHQHSDDEDDPHSPHLHGHGWRGLFQGLWHAHCGWLFQRTQPRLFGYIPDLHKDPTLRVVSRLFPLWVFLGLALPAAAGGLLTWSWPGALIGFCWGGLARIFLVHHVTWSINSICHVWGARPFRTHDESRNNVVFGVLAMGEGWHNNHHAFPASARHGLRWWELDASWYFIKTLELCRLAWDVKLPSPQRLEAARAKGAETAQ